MNIETIAFARVNPAPYNPRVLLKPEDQDWKDIEASMAEFGLVQPFVWNKRTGNLVGGHQRLNIAKHKGAQDGPMVVVDLDPIAEKKLNVVLNSVGGRWDAPALQSVLAELKLEKVELGFLGLRKLEAMRILPMSGSQSGPAMARASLAKRFGVPPFSVLDARQGYWQERKAAWLALGIQSEMGRGENLLKFSDSVKLGGTIEQQKGGAPAGLCFGAIGEQFTTPKTGTSIFDPVLCELAYRWFTRPGWQILDPFAEGSVRGITAGILGRCYTGIDLRPEQVQANQDQAGALMNGDLGDLRPGWLAGDSTDQETYQRLPLNRAGDYDFVFSCPPYGDLEVYSADPLDISTKPYAEFRALMTAAVGHACSLLKPNRFAAFVVGDFRDKQGFYRNFVSHTIEAFEAAGMLLYNEAILVTAIGSLPIRIGKQFGRFRKLGKTHQQLLVFYKGDPQQIPDVLGECEFGDLPAPDPAAIEPAQTEAEAPAA